MDLIVLEDLDDPVFSLGPNFAFFQEMDRLENPDTRLGARQGFVAFGLDQRDFTIEPVVPLAFFQKGIFPADLQRLRNAFLDLSISLFIL
jgi:hypothetical protein